MSKILPEFTPAALKSDKLILVDFWAPWCGPCKALTPQIEALAAEMADKVAFFQVNVDEQQDITNQYGVRAVPTLLLFKNGQMIGQQIGNIDRIALKARLTKNL